MFILFLLFVTAGLLLSIHGWRKKNKKEVIAGVVLLGSAALLILLQIGFSYYVGWTEGI